MNKRNIMEKIARRIFLISTAVLLLVLSAATFFEKYRGTDWVNSTVYGTMWFALLWALLAVSGVWLLCRRRRYIRPAVVLLHLAFVVILAGALLTRLTAERGVLHLKVGVPVDTYLTDSRTTAHLPFSVTLQRFDIRYYRGTNAPSDFVSTITISLPSGEVLSAQVSMNNIAVCGGWRFYQSSFDDDGQGSWLSLNRDVFGIPVTYAGYALLFFAFAALLLDPHGRCRRLARRISRPAAVLLLFLPVANVAAAPSSLSRADAAEFGQVQVLFGDRVVPLQTLAIDFTRKLVGDDSYRGMTAEQVFAGWLFYPQEWQYEPMIRVKSRAMQEFLGVGKYASFIDFFDTAKQYRLEPYLRKAYADAGNDAWNKAVREADEKVQLVLMQQQGALLAMFPFADGGRMTWHTPVDAIPDSVAVEYRRIVQGLFPLMYTALQEGDTTRLRTAIAGLKRFQRQAGGDTVLSDAEMAAERLYNAVPFTSLLFMSELTLGFLAFAFYFLFFRRSSRVCRVVDAAFVGCFVLAFLVLTGAVALRTCIGGRLPLGNAYETMLSLAWFVMLFTLLLRRRVRWVLSFGFLLSGFALLVCHIRQMDPQITPLMPVLSSPLLSIHVSCIMAAYALLSVLSLNSAVALCLSPASAMARQQTLLGRFLLYPALFLLTAGIFIGAVWANVSWGTYWSWDPKEVWALITLLVYAFPLHDRLLLLFRHPRFFHAFLAAAFITVLMTYFGVNYFLGGLHSYAD